MHSAPHRFNKTRNDSVRHLKSVNHAALLRTAIIILQSSHSPWRKEHYLRVRSLPIPMCVCNVVTFRFLFTWNAIPLSTPRTRTRDWWTTDKPSGGARWFMSPYANCDQSIGRVFFVLLNGEKKWRIPIIKPEPRSYRSERSEGESSRTTPNDDNDDAESVRFPIDYLVDPKSGPERWCLMGWLTFRSSSPSTTDHSRWEDRYERGVKRRNNALYMHSPFVVLSDRWSWWVMFGEDRWDGW